MSAPPTTRASCGALAAGRSRAATDLLVTHSLCLRSRSVCADKTGHYEIALDRFCHYLALVETDPSTTVVSEMRATLTSNIGSCLHQLGNVEAAQDYFEKALQEFKAQPFSLMSRISPYYFLFGDLTSKRCQYIEAKLASIRAGEPPDPSQYQDGYGKMRKWTKEEMEGRPGFSIFNPRSWFGYGKVHEVGVVPNQGVATAA